MQMKIGQAGIHLSSTLAKLRRQALRPKSSKYKIYKESIKKR